MSQFGHKSDDQSAALNHLIDELQDPTVDVLATYFELREAMNNARALFTDLDRGRGARSITIRLLAGETRRAADAAQLLLDANVGDAHTTLLGDQR